MREQIFHSDFRNANVLTRVSMCVLCCPLFSPHLARPFYTKKFQLKIKPFCLKSRRSVLPVSAWVLSKYFDFFFSHCSKTRKWSGDLATMLKYLQAWMWSLACLAVSPCCKLATSCWNASLTDTVRILKCWNSKTDCKLVDRPFMCLLTSAWHPLGHSW